MFYVHERNVEISMCVSNLLTYGHQIRIIGVQSHECINCLTRYQDDFVFKITKIKL